MLHIFKWITVLDVNLIMVVPRHHSFGCDRKGLSHVNYCTLYLFNSSIRGILGIPQQKDTICMSSSSIYCDINVG